MAFCGSKPTKQVPLWGDLQFYGLCLRFFGSSHALMVSLPCYNRNMLKFWVLKCFDEAYKNNHVCDGNFSGGGRVA